MEKIKNKTFLLLTKLSVSGSSQKKGFPSFSCFLTKFSISTSKLAEVVPSEPCVDCSHFSNNKANNGNSGCLGGKIFKMYVLHLHENILVRMYAFVYITALRHSSHTTADQLKLYNAMVSTLFTGQAYSIFMVPQGNPAAISSHCPSSPNPQPQATTTHFLPEF